MTPPTHGPDNAAVVVLVVLGLLTAVVSYVWFAAALASVLRKLGGEPWRAWVPVLNVAEVFERGGAPGWQVLFFVVPVVGVYGYVLYVQAVHRIGRQFGRGAGTTVLGALLPPVWASVLGWSSAQPSFDRVPVAPAGASGGGAWGGVAPAVAEGSPGTPYDRDETPGRPVPAPAVTAAAPGASPWAPVAVASAPVPPPAPRPVELAPVLAPFPAPVPDPVPVVAPVPFAAPVPDVVPVVAPVPFAAPVPDVVPVVAPVPFAAPVPDLVPVAAPDAAPDDDDELEGTVMVERDVPEPWTLVLDDGRQFSVSGTSVLVGRRPTSTDPSVGVLAIADPERTVSKVHARLDLVDGGWLVTDLASTNGVHLVAADGTEQRLAAHVATPVQGRLTLGTIGMRLVAPGGAS